MYNGCNPVTLWKHIIFMNGIKIQTDERMRGYEDQFV